MRGRPILGVISGFFFGIFLALTLFLYGIIPLESWLIVALPFIGIILGLVMAAWAPFGRGRSEASPAPPEEPAGA